MRIPDPVVRWLIEPLWDLYEGSVRLSTYRHLARVQFLSSTQFENRRDEKLRAIVRHAAASCPFYRRGFEAAGLDPGEVRYPADLATLPVTTKAEVHEHRAEMFSTAYTGEELVQAKTGGSTGTPLQIFCDRRGVQMRHGAALLADTWSGWRLGQPVAAVWGNPVAQTTWRGRLRRAFKDRIIFLDTMRLDESAVRTFIDDWSRLRPGLLYGHAHSLFLLAEMVEAQGVKLRPDGIVATSMMLLQPEREVIERVFDRQVTNRYGCEEVSLIACECEQHEGMHVNAEHLHVEVLRDDGTPCEPGEDGRLVVTEYVNRGMPLLRYEVGDRGVWHDQPCRCGRPYPLLRAVTGRTADFLVAADGRLVAGISLIENSLTRFPGIAQMQLVQEAVDHLLVNLVKGQGWREEATVELETTFRRYLGRNLRVVFRHPAAIPREPNGKYRFSICRVEREGP